MAYPFHFLVFLLAALVAVGAPARAQGDFVEAGSDLDLPLEEYLKHAGARAKLIAPGDLKIDGHRMVCGKRPTVIDPEFASWGGAYPGYLILNPERLKGLSTAVKLFVYAHECGHQFIGRDEQAADCFGVRRGRRYGWLNEQGLDEICRFMKNLKGDWDHSAGTDRCRKMTMCYRQAAPRAARN